MLRIIPGIIVTAMWVEMSIKNSYKNDRFGIGTSLMTQEIFVVRAL